MEDLELAARLVFGKQGREFDPPPLPYRDVQLPDKLRFGYYLSGQYDSSSPGRGAVACAVRFLRQICCAPLTAPCYSRHTTEPRHTLLGFMPPRY